LDTQLCKGSSNLTANLTYPSPARRATQSRCAVSGKRIAERGLGGGLSALLVTMCQYFPTCEVLVQFDQSSPSNVVHPIAFLRGFLPDYTLLELRVQNQSGNPEGK
jgi:hypothetical protein